MLDSILWLLDTHPWYFTVLLFWVLFAIAEIAWRITGAVQAWHRRQFFKRETQRMRRQHAAAYAARLEAESIRRRAQLDAVSGMHWRS